ncbi:hypothetical protein JXB01_03975 [Candidatus Micrarchaeota archaeon]|nr:hypothetical protein [Candidatus Micrarchaeota archaeon]
MKRIGIKDDKKGGKQGIPGQPKTEGIIRKPDGKEMVKSYMCLLEFGNAAEIAREFGIGNEELKEIAREAMKEEERFGNDYRVSAIRNFFGFEKEN